MFKKGLLPIMAMMIFLVSACSEQVTPEEARMKLKDLGIEYTPESFVERVGQGDAFAVDLFLKAGMDVNAKDKDGNPALMAAAAKGQRETVKALIEEGADVNAKSKYGWTALGLAEREGHTETEVVNLLKEHGAKK